MFDTALDTAKTKRAHRLIATFALVTLLSSYVHTSVGFLEAYGSLVSAETVIAQTTSITLRGNFQRESAVEKYEKTWIASITCRSSNGGTQIIGGSGDPWVVQTAVANAINQNNLPYAVPSSALMRSEGGTGGGNLWNDNGAPHTPTLNAVCQILGFDSYVSSTCLDNDSSGRYPNGKCNFHSPEDNYLYRFVPGIAPAACDDDVDNDGDGKIDFPNDLGCVDSNDNDERDLTCPDGSRTKPERRTIDGPFTLRGEVNRAGQSKGITHIYEEYERSGALHRDQETADIACRVLGYDKAVFVSGSSTEYGSRDSFTSCNDNYIAFANVSGANFDLRNACDDNKWIGTITCERAALVCPEHSDVIVFKSASSTTVQEGNEITYIATVRNIGQVPTVGVRLTDTVPSGLSFVPARSNSLCKLMPYGKEVVCDNFVLQPNNSKELKLVFMTNVMAGSCSDRNTQNIAQVSANNDPTTSNNQSNTVITAITCPPVNADLDITKTPKQSSVQPGQALAYDIRVRNSGPTNAEQVVVRDRIPEGLNFQFASGASCQIMGGFVFCTLGTIQSGDTRTFTLNFTVRADQQCQTGVIANSADVTSTSTDPNQSNNRSKTVNVNLTCPEPLQADLSITKSTTQQNIQQGQTITYTINVNNNGPATAEQVIVRDNVPSGTEFASSAGVFCQMNGNTVECSIGNLAHGASKSFTLAFRTRTAQVCDPITIQNNATVSSNTSDSNSTNNRSNTVGVRLECPGPQSDLSIRKTGASTISQGGVMTYMLRVTNAGPQTAANVVVSDVIPTGLTFRSQDSDASCILQGNSVVCNNFSLSAGQSRDIQVAFNVTTSTTCGGTIVNQAAVATSSTDPNSANNQSQTVVTTVQCAPTTSDLRVSKTSTPTSVQEGQNVTFTLVVENIGQAATANAELIDTIPSGLTYQSAQSDSRCIQQGNQIRCQNFTVQPGQSQNFNLVFRVDATQACVPRFIQNIAAVSAQNDPTTGNNSSNTVITAVTCLPATADLSVTKSAQFSSVQRGSAMTYVVTATNNGPAAATNVAIADVVPSGLQFLASGSSPECQFHVQSNSVVCNNFSLAPGQQRSVNIAFTVLPTVICNSQIQNRASVSTSITDPNPANNQSNIVNTTVTCPVENADLSITKTAHQTSVQRGSVVTYTLTVSNAGPAIGTNIAVADIVPSHLTFDPTQSDTACRLHQGTNSVVCDNFQLSSGQSRSFQLKFRVNETATCNAVINNSASVSTSATDPNSANNQSQTVTTVTCLPATADLSVTKSAQFSSVQRGSAMTYVVTATNNGPAAATNVAIADVVPSGLQFLASGSSPECQFHVQSNSVVCNNFSLAPGQQRSVNIAFTVLPTVICNSQIQNRASVSTSITDPNPANNQSNIVNTTVTCPEPTFTVTKTDNVVTAQPGQTLTYTITITNTSAFAATNVTATDAIPAHTTFLQASDVGTYSNGIVTWTGLSVAPGAQKILTIQTRVNDNAQEGAVLVNIARVGSVTGTDATTVQQPLPVNADLSITKTAHQTSVQRGSVVTYTLTVSNAGPAIGTNIAVADIVPSHLTFDPTQSDTACRLHQGTNSVVCDNFQLSSGQSRSFQLKFRVNETATCNAVINNSASVSTSATDPNSANNQSQTVTTVISCPQATLTISKTDNKTTAAPGETLTYAISITNASNVNATNVKVKDVLPSDVAFVSATDGAVRTGQMIKWTGISIAAGATKTLTVTATVKQNTSNNTVLTNRATILEGGPYAIDTTTVIVTQPMQADLSIVKSKVSTGTTVQPGGSITYSLVVSNAGPGIGTNLVVADVVPANLTLDAAGSDAGCHFQSVANRVICDNFSLNAGQSRTFLVKFNVAASTSCTASPIQNSATIATSATDPNASNNVSAIVSTLIQCVPGLSVTKTDNHTTALPGELLTYLINVVNTSSVAQTTAVRDVLSPFTFFDSASNGGTASGQILTWHNIVVAANSGRTLTLKARVIQTATAGSQIVNAVILTNGATANDTTTVQPAATGALLTLDIVDNPDPVEADEDLTYTIRLTNLRNTPTASLTVTQVLPSDVEAESISDSGTEQSNVITWTGIVIPANSTRELVVRVHVDEDADDDDILLTTVFVNGISDSETTRVEGDDNDDDEDLDLSITDSMDPVAPGDTLTYDITIENNGNDKIKIDVDGFLDENTSFVSASNGGDEKSDERVEWQNIKIDEDDSITLRLTVRVDQNADDGDRLRFRARSGDEDDTELTEVRASAPSQPTGPVSVTVDKQSDRSEAFPGDEVFYTITITNTSTVKASNITIEDSFPIQDLAVTNVEGGGQITGNGTITWTIPMLEAGQSHTVRYSARVSFALRLGQIVRNTVSVRSPDFPQGFSDTHEVRVIEMLPQTGGFNITGSVTAPQSFITSPNGPSAGSTGAASLPIIIWTTIMTLGMGTGTLIGRRYFLI